MNEEPEGQTPLLFLQSLAMRCDAIPKKKSCPGPAKGLTFSSQHSKGAVRSGEMLEMSHCQVGVCWLMTGRTWVDV